MQWFCLNNTWVQKFKQNCSHTHTHTHFQICKPKMLLKNDINTLSDCLPFMSVFAGVQSWPGVWQNVFKICSKYNPRENLRVGKFYFLHPYMGQTISICPETLRAPLYTRRQCSISQWKLSCVGHELRMSTDSWDIFLENNLTARYNRKRRLGSPGGSNCTGVTLGSSPSLAPSAWNAHWIVSYYL